MRRRDNHDPRFDVRVYMLQVLDRHRDAAGVVSCTTLAEDAADEYDLYTGDEIPEWVFELAYTVAEGEGQ